MNVTPKNRGIVKSNGPLVGGLVVLAFLYLLRLGPFPTYPAFGDDNSAYLVLAKALAEGRGFRLINYPNAPIQSLYPIGYPALLSIVFSGPLVDSRSIFLARSISAISCVAFVYFGQRFLLRYTSAWIATGVALTIGLGLTAFDFAGEIYAECPFAMMAMAALVCANNALDSEGENFLKCLNSAVAAGLCAALAMLLRSVGVTVIASILLTYVANAKWRQLRLFTVSTGALLSPWLVWTMLHRGGTFSSYHSAFLSEFTWRDPVDHLYTLCTAVLPSTLFPAFETQTILGVLKHAGLLWVEPAIGIVATLFFLVGICILVKARDLSSICIICYMGVVIVCPWEPSRYALPILPVLAVPLLEGYRVVIVESKRLPCIRQGGTTAQWVCIAVGLCGGLGISTMRLRNVYIQNHWGGSEAAREWSDINTAFGWIDKHLPADAVLVSSYPFGTYLFTGRNTLAQMPGMRLGEILSNAPTNRPLYVFATERSYFLTGREFGVTPVREYMGRHPGVLRPIWSNLRRTIQIFTVSQTRAVTTVSRTRAVTRGHI